MNFYMEKSMDGVLSVRLTIEERDMVHARFDRFDELLIKECEGSGMASDKLLALETIVRKIEQAAIAIVRRGG